MTRPKVDDGNLDVASFNQLSKDELRDWMEMRLQGGDLDIPVDVRREERPYYLIADIYPELDRFVRQDVHAIVVDFVHDMACNPDTNWRDRAGHELLLLSQWVCKGDTTKLLFYLHQMAEDRRWFDPQGAERGSDLHYRVLQSLVALGWLGTTSFWQAQCRLAPERYVGVAFNGLALINPEQAIRLLTEVEWTDTVGRRLLNALPHLLRMYTPARVVSLLDRHWKEMPHRAQESIREFLQEEEVNFSPGGDQDNAWDLHRVKDVLSTKGYPPQPRLHAPLVNDEDKLDDVA